MLFWRVKMKENDIVRTTIYLPRNLHTILKKREINMSRMVRAFIDTILQDDELEIIERKIMQLKKRLQELEAKRQYLLQQREKEKLQEETIMEKARKFVAYLNNLFKQEPYDLEMTLITSQALQFIQEEFGVNLKVKDILQMQQKAKSNGGEIHIEDILPYFEKLAVARKEAKEVIHA